MAIKYDPTTRKNKFTVVDKINMRLLRILVNWSWLLTTLLWLGFVFITHFLNEALEGRGSERDALLGREWFWK